MSTVNPAAFRLLAFERHWQAQLDAMPRTVAAGGDVLHCRLVEEMNQWVGRGRQIGYFPPEADEADGADEAGVDEPGSYPPDPTLVWDFDRALSRALDFLTTDQLALVDLLLFIDEKSWIAAVGRAERLLDRGTRHAEDDIESAGWLLQEWPWDERADEPSGPWASDWRLSGLPAASEDLGNHERVEQARQLREAIRAASERSVAAAPPAVSLPERLRARLKGSLAVLSATMRPQPVMGDDRAAEMPMTVAFDVSSADDVLTEARAFRADAQVTVWLSHPPPGSRILLAVSSGEGSVVAEQDARHMARPVVRFELPWPHQDPPTQLLVAVFE